MPVSSYFFNTFCFGIHGFFKAHTAEELEEESIKRGIRMHKVCNTADTLANIQLKARNFWVGYDRIVKRGKAC